MTIRLLLLLLIPCFSMGQQISGEWVGFVSQEEGAPRPEYGYSCQMKVVDGKVTGSSRIWMYDQADIFAEMKIEGKMSGETIEFTEVEITDQQTFFGFTWCYKTVTLSISLLEGKLYLDGPWHGRDNDSDCLPGSIHLVKITGFPDREKPNPPAQPEQTDTLITITESETDLPPGDYAPIENTPPSEPIDVITTPENDNHLNGRSVVVQGSAVVKQKEMTLYVWDTDEVDGDRVSLVFNGEKILSDFKLSKDRYAFTVTLVPGQENLLMLYAENLGKTPPNTAAISWWEGGQLKTKVLHSDMSKCGTLSFKSE